MYFFKWYKNKSSGLDLRIWNSGILIFNLAMQMSWISDTTSLSASHLQLHHPPVHTCHFISLSDRYLWSVHSVRPSVRFLHSMTDTPSMCFFLDRSICQEQETCSCTPVQATRWPAQHSDCYLCAPSEPLWIPAQGWSLRQPNHQPACPGACLPAHS